MKKIAQQIIDKFEEPTEGDKPGRSGFTVVAEILGLDTSVVYRFTYAKSVGGTGGTVPLKHMPALLLAAEERKIKLAAADFYEPAKKK